MIYVQITDHLISQTSFFFKLKKMVKMLIDKGHEAMLEHSQLSVLFICDRGVSHEIVRHRLASFAQESTRYCNYGDDKFGNEITVVRPFYLFGDNSSATFNSWSRCMVECENRYFELLKQGKKPQEARAVLPNSLKTEIMVTGNWREWRHCLKLRTAKDAHPDIRGVMNELLNYVKTKVPAVFDDIP
jgi:thymidylate synthase (FAD)